MQINELTVSVKAEGNLRNDPPQSSECSLASEKLGGTWGVPTPKIVKFFAQPPLSSATVLSQSALTSGV